MELCEMKSIELGNVYDMIQYFKVNWRKLEKLKKKKKTKKGWLLVLWERDLRMITHLAIWTPYFNLSCPSEDFQEDVSNSSYKKLGGGKQTKKGKAGRIW